MTDVRIKQNFNFAEQLWDWALRTDGQLDQSEELATAVRVALGTDRLADEDTILPDLDSTDRRGWWGDMDAESIWNGWPIGTKNWVLARSKITQAPSEEGSTVERARQYTLEALQPFIDNGVASRVEVEAERTELHRIDVHAVIYRGPLPEIDLRYQLLWQEDTAPEIPFSLRRYLT
jgi:phage gp46-like protein